MCWISHLLERREADPWRNGTHRLPAEYWVRLLPGASSVPIRFHRRESLRRPFYVSSVCRPFSVSSEQLLEQKEKNTNELILETLALQQMLRYSIHPMLGKHVIVFSKSGSLFAFIFIDLSA